MENKPNEKKAWVEPALIVYGDLAELTQQNKNKHLGGGDDFNTNISSI